MKREKYVNFSLIISLESLINQLVWGWGGVLSVIPSAQAEYDTLSNFEKGLTSLNSMLSLS